MRKLAEMAGVCWQTVSNIEHGRPYKLSTIKELAKVLDVTVCWLGCFELLPEKTFPDKLKKARLIHGLSRKEAAKLIGCDVKSLFFWENGYRAPVDKFINIIEKFIDNR